MDRRFKGIPRAGRATALVLALLIASCNHDGGTPFAPEPALGTGNDPSRCIAGSRIPTAEELGGSMNRCR